MKKIALIIIGLIGLYAFLRNNVGRLPEQIILTTNPDIFYKTFIPLLMLASSTFAFISAKKVNYFYLSVLTLFIDAVNRLATFVNHLYNYLIYDHAPPTVESTSLIVVKINLVLSHIILLIEIVTIFFLFRYSSLFGNKESQ